MVTMAEPSERAEDIRLQQVKWADFLGRLQGGTDIVRRGKFF